MPRKPKSETKPAPRWLTTRAMAQELGVTAQTLRRFRSRLKEGIHYYSVNPDGDRPTYRWHKEKMLKQVGIRFVTN